MKFLCLLGFALAVSISTVVGGYEELEPEVEPVIDGITSPKPASLAPTIFPHPWPTCQRTVNDTDGDCILGEGGKDYPILIAPPTDSKFNCSAQKFPGLYADPVYGCQVWHICQTGNRKDSFICTRGSIFNQQYFVCDWWFNVKCSLAPTFYHLNEFFYVTPSPADAKPPVIALPGAPQVPSKPVPAVPAVPWSPQPAVPGSPISPWLPPPAVESVSPPLSQY